MVSSFILLILYPFVLLSSRECICPIQTWQWCRFHIGVFPSGLSPGGFLWFTSDLFGLPHHRDRDWAFIFSKLTLDFQSQIWDPGDSNYRKGNGDIRLWISHMSGSRFVFVSGIGFSVLFRSKTSVTCYIDRLSLGLREMLQFPQSDHSSPDVTYVSDLSVSNWRTEKLRNLIRLFRRENTCVRFLLSPFDVHSFITGTCLFQSNVHFSNLRCGDLIRSWNLGVNDGDSMVSLMELWLFKFRFCWTAMARLHVVLVAHWQPYLLGFVQIWWLENIFAMFRRTYVDKRGSHIWNAMETFFVFMLKGITESTFLGKTLVRKCWCHYVYLSELALDTSALLLRFVKRSHSHKLLFTIRNKEKSNMKLDNNRFLDRLASKTTLRKASSNSLLLYFLLVYGTYICVCNNCASIILYVFVITFFLNE